MVRGTVLFPGTGFAELALQAGQHTDCPVVEELTLHAPLVLRRAPRPPSRSWWGHRTRGPQVRGDPRPSGGPSR
ncbi:hypothetical protein D3C59_35670, partial [Streptomyces sp. SHP22-7]